MLIFIIGMVVALKCGTAVGSHLELLSLYFFGYRVTFLGSFVGFAYGCMLDTLSGPLIRWIYNKTVKFRN